jgi:hypothetical protein
LAFADWRAVGQNRDVILSFGETFQ